MRHHVSFAADKMLSVNDLFDFMLQYNVAGKFHIVEPGMGCIHNLKKENDYELICCQLP